MAKYSDHSTIGGQVLAHRIRMIRQNANIIFTAGKIGFLVGYVGYLCYRIHLWEFWDFLCMLKADLTKNWVFFNGSYVMDANGNFRYMKDYVIRQYPELEQAKSEICDLLIQDLWIAGIFALLVMIGVGVVHKRIGKKLTDKKELISGHNYVDGKGLKKLVKEKSEITIAGIPYPKGSEARHTLITGTTGSGKTNAIIELIDQVEKLGERAIIVDTVGTYVNRYYNRERGDIILNPLDPRSQPWSFLKECSGQELLRNVASCILDKGGDGDRFWEDAAKIVFVETAKKIQAQGKSLEEFIDILLKLPLNEMQEYLKGSYGGGLIDKNADKMALSIRAMLINSVHIFDTLREEEGNNFSIRDWLSSDDKGFLFLSCTPKERGTVIPMITAWLSIAGETLMQLPESDKRTWFFIDELHNLKKLPKLDQALAEIRKFGGCYVMGTQLIAQLEKVYGRELTRAITGLCGTKVVMNVPEPITAKYMADFLGDKEEITTLEALSYGANIIRDGANISQRYSKESVVSGSQIMFLKTGEAFLKLYGIETIGKVIFKYHERRSYIESREGSRITQSEYLQKYENGTVNSMALTLCGLKLTDRILAKPLCVYVSDDSWKKFFYEIRNSENKAIVFETKGELSKKCRIENIESIIGGNAESTCSWDIFKDFEGKYDVLTEEFTKNLDEERQVPAKEYLTKVFFQMKDFILTNHPREVLDTLLFMPIRESFRHIDRLFNTEDKDAMYVLDILRNAIAKENRYLKNCFNAERTISLSENNVTFCNCEGKDMQELSKLMQSAAAKSIKILDCKTLLKSKSIQNTIVNVGQNVFKENKESYLIESGALGLQPSWKNIFEGTTAPFPKVIAKEYGGFETIEIH